MKAARLAILIFILTPICGHGAEITPNEKTVVAGNSVFAFDLYAKLREQKGNLFLSPYSISTALAMTYGGAHGETAAQLAKALHFDLSQEQLHPAFAELQAGLNTLQAQGYVKLHVANSLWPQKGYDLVPAYLDLCKKYYGVTITPVDFAGATERARQTINEWVEAKTERKIRDLIKPGVLTSSNRLALVNAIYFKGEWQTKFDKQLTRDEPFNVSAGKIVDASLMQMQDGYGRLPYAELPELQVLELPYTGGALSMIVFLPRQKDGLPTLEQKLTAKNFAAWTEPMRWTIVRLWLPKFKTSSEFSLEKTLAELGMGDAFKAGHADFFGMDGGKLFYIGAAVHKAIIDVGEDGTEAAAASAILDAPGGVVERPKPPVFRADHPFLFVIRDNRTGSILFLGRIVDPTTQPRSREDVCG